MFQRTVNSWATSSSGLRCPCLLVVVVEDTFPFPRMWGGTQTAGQFRLGWPQPGPRWPGEPWCLSPALPLPTGFLALPLPREADPPAPAPIPETWRWSFLSQGHLLISCCSIPKATLAFHLCPQGLSSAYTCPPPALFLATVPTPARLQALAHHPEMSTSSLGRPWVAVTFTDGKDSA